jgi:hypothetical protein
MNFAAQTGHCAEKLLANAAYHSIFLGGNITFSAFLLPF